MDLINMLTSQLGVTDDQAKGGAGMIFDLVKDKVSASDFSSLTESAPEVSSMVGATSKSGGGLMDAVGSIASSFGGGDSSLGNLAGLVSGFAGLDLDAGMVTKFIPVVLEFVKGKGGDGLMGIVSSVLK